ncbi:MAG: HAD-IB family hydrolase [Actinomycetota bacterium]
MVENGAASDLPASSLVRSALSGKRILVTGATGFLGTALLERLLTDLPDTHVILLIRGRADRTPRQRLDEILSGPAFGRLRSSAEEPLSELLDRRVTIVEGDVAEPDRLPRLPQVDVCYHCAATVSFDPPIDDAFRTNVLGAVGFYQALVDQGQRPYLIHVSTAYVAGSKKGVVLEAPLQHDVEWRREVDAAISARIVAEDASRKPEMLDRFMAAAEAEHRRAGPMAVADDAEERRRRWVTRRLIQYGRARAQSLGWPDVYTLTKALGERATEQLARERQLPLAIVRPSIIESSLERPRPGWIEGFKMAEPVILAYGRGAIPEFPAIPEGILDLIPVDLVVNALLAAGAVPPPPAEPAYYHVCSGSRNPLSFRSLYENVREYFQHHPLPERGRGTYRVPQWHFPGRRVVDARLRTGERALETVDRIVSRLPRSDRVRGWIRTIDRTKGRLDFIRRYADLYGAYAEAEVIYTDEHTVALFRSLPDQDQRDFPFDASMIDWRHYLQEVHCPSISIALRFPSPGRAEPAVRVRPTENGVLAVFDMEGTLLDSNVIETYLWLRLAELPADEWPGQIASVARRLPSYLGAERRDRGEFLRKFYRRYRGASVEGVERLMRDQVGELMLQRVSAPAIRRIREHRVAGHRTVLITGALRWFADPLAPLFDHVEATELAEDFGRFTGDLRTPPLVGEARAAWLRRFAAASGADLARSYAYADSHSDLPLLRAVGNPVAVNPDVALYRVARRDRWPVERWTRAAGTSRVLIPEKVPV